MAAIIAVDPGGQHTAIIAVEGGKLRGRVTVTRDTRQPRRGQGIIDQAYLDEVRHQLREAYLLVHERAIDVVRVALEDVVAPSPHMGLTDPTGVLGAAVVAGAVCEWAAQEGLAPVVIVPPGGHGQGPHVAYPRALHDPRGGCRGGGACNSACVAPKGTRRHERASWDVGVAAEGLLRRGAA